MLLDWDCPSLLTILASRTVSTSGGKSTSPVVPVSDFVQYENVAYSTPLMSFHSVNRNTEHWLVSNKAKL